MRTSTPSYLTAIALSLPLVMGAVGLASSLTGCVVEAPSDTAMSSEVNGGRPGYGSQGGSGYGSPNGYGDVDGYEVDGYE